MISRDAAVICGRDWFDESFRQLDVAIAIDWSFTDGEPVPAGAVVCRIDGKARAILTAERTALNFLQTLSATATVAALFVKSVEGTGAVILDTRKTVPGLRSAQKYAVRCGGASNHRLGLHDAILIKENHIAALGSIEAAVAKARAAAGEKLVEVEVETLEQAESALQSGADRLLLDNFSLEMLRAAVALKRKLVARQALEASGGITLANIRGIAETGVDYISVGSITKNVAAVDFSLRVIGHAGAHRK